MSLSVHASQSPNLAPQAGLQKAMEDRANDKTVQVDADWFKTEKRLLEQENKQTFDNQTLIWAMTFMVIEGKGLLRRAKYGHGWRAAPLPDRTDIPVYSFNLAGFYSDNIKAKWTSSNTDIDWCPSNDLDKTIGASKGADSVHDYYKRKLYTQNFRQMEALLAQCGKYARYYYVSDEAKAYARRPKTETKTLQFGQGSFFCPDCGNGGSLADITSKGASDLDSGWPPNDVANGIEEGALYSNQRDFDGVGGVNGQSAISLRPDTRMVGQGFDSESIQGSQLGGIDRNAAPAQSDNRGDQGLPETNLAGGRNVSGLPRQDLGSSGGFAGEQIGLPGEGSEPSGGHLCPDCGSPNIDIQQPEPLEIETVTGYETVERPDLCCETVPAFELKHELTKQPHESEYLIRRRRVRTAILQSKFDFIEVRSAKGDDWGLRAEDSLKRSTGAAHAGYFSKDTNDEPTTDFIQVWLDPCMYRRLVLKEEMATLSGMTIPAGTRLVELFPKGLYMCFIEGVDGVVELRNEHHRDFWVGQVYRMRAISSMGTGIEDIIEGNRQYNLVMSIIYTQLRTSAMPATLFDERLMPHGVSAYLGSLSNIPVDLAALDDKRALRDAIFQLQPQPPTEAHFGYGQQMNNYMQMASRVTDFSGGLPGVNNDTATGAQIASANSQSLFGPQLALKAEVDRRGAEIILNLFKMYAIDEVWISLSGKRGKQDGMWLSSADISTDLFAEVVPDSYLPQTNLERRERWDAFLQRVGGLPGLQMALQQSPEQVEQLADIFDVDLASADYTAAAELCRDRIEQMKSALPMLQIMQQGMPQVQMSADPVTGQMMQVPVDPIGEAGKFLIGILKPPIEAEEVGHLASIGYLRSWLTEDEGKQSAPELRAGIKAMIYAHVDGLVAEAQLTGMVQVAGQPMPVMPVGQPGMEKTGSKNPNPNSKQMTGSAGPLPVQQEEMGAMAAMAG